MMGFPNKGTTSFKGLDEEEGKRKDMGLIYKEIMLRGDKGEGRFQALWDNGSSESFIRRDLAGNVGTILRLSAPRQFEMGKGMLSVEESTGIVNVKVEGFDLFWHFLVVPDLSEELIIGADFLQRWKIKLDPESERIIIDPKALKLKLGPFNRAPSLFISEAEEIADRAAWLSRER